MRVLFLVPDLVHGSVKRRIGAMVLGSEPSRIGRWMLRHYYAVPDVYGGTLNLFRQHLVLKSLGVETCLASVSGLNTYGNVLGEERPLSFMKWADRRSDDICIIPDIASRTADDVTGPVVIYEQSPLFVRPDFNFARSNLRILTDSPPMQQLCCETFGGVDVEIGPNVVDSHMFRYIPQSEREPGLLFAFPRKGADFIAETRRSYAEFGGTYWRFELVENLSILQLADRMRRPQAFLASGHLEGCALPPQEAMAAGIVVVGRTASGANFYMEDGRTSLNAETPLEAAHALKRLENTQLREHLSKGGFDYISRFFPVNEPSSFWRDYLNKNLSKLGSRSDHVAHGS